MSPSDTPTYDQLSALCAQMAAALEATQFGFNHRRCPVCAGWNVGPHGETDKAHTKYCPVARALTAYRTLSPDPVWQRVPEGCVVVPEEATPEMMDDAVKAARSAPPPLSDPAPGHRQIRAAYAAFLNRARGEG